MKKSHLSLVLTAALTCALLLAGVVGALDIVTNDASLAAAGGSPVGAASALLATPETSAVATTTTTAPAPTTTTVPPTTTTAAPTTTTVAPTTTTAFTFPGGLVIQPSYQVVSAVGQVQVRVSPGAVVVKTLPRLNAINKVTTLPVITMGSSFGMEGWYQVRLAQRPNGSTGWVSSSEVEIDVRTQVIVIERAAHRLTLFDGGVKLGSYPVCIGTDINPTPIGTFCALGVILPGGGAYGPFAIPTSAYSDSLPDWPGGGVVGIHGTNNPDSVGKSVSHGCVRMYNKDITEVVQVVVPGTPIFMVP